MNWEIIIGPVICFLGSLASYWLGFRMGRKSAAVDDTELVADVAASLQAMKNRMESLMGDLPPIEH